MLVMLGVGALAVGWIVCVLLVLGLVIMACERLGWYDYPTQLINLAIGLGVVMFLSIAPLVAIILLRVN